MLVHEVITNQDSTAGKHGGNAESTQAWSKPRHGAAQMRDRIYRTLKHNIENCGWDQGITSKEIAEALGKPLHTISGRFTDLAELGFIRKTQFVRDGSRAWEIVK